MTAGDPGYSNDPGPVGDWEEVGRRVFSRSDARHAANNKVPRKIFEERLGRKELSADRLTLAGETGIAGVVADAVNAAANRPQPPNSFSGWAVVTAEKARNAGCEVIASPQLPANPYHADIVLPDAAMESLDARRHYAATLASMARWRPPPKSNPNPTETAG